MFFCLFFVCLFFPFWLYYALSSFTQFQLLINIKNKTKVLKGHERVFTLSVTKHNYLTGKEMVLPSSKGCLHIALFTWYFLALRNLQCLYFFYLFLSLSLLLLFQIKFLLNKPGTAMVEMSDHVACNTIIQCLGKQKLFDKQLDVRFEIRLF